MTDWLTMTAGTFDQAAPDVQLAMLAAPDRLGTPDLFETEPTVGSATSEEES